MDGSASAVTVRVARSRLYVFDQRMGVLTVDLPSLDDPQQVGGESRDLRFVFKGGLCEKNTCYD
jgi:hypothetical protein